MTIKEQYLQAYDQQLRTKAETTGASSLSILGPLHLATFRDSRGFITYQDLAGYNAESIKALVSEALQHFEGLPEVVEVEWKTRGHDHAPGLHAALLAQGFTPEDDESIMVGPLEALCHDVPAPAGATFRKVISAVEVRAMSAMVRTAFGEPNGPDRSDDLMARLARNDGTELWVAELNGIMVSAGRLEPVPHTDFAGIWGGATLQEYRGRGIYRALTAARARSALAMGKTLVNSDCTEFSRPILERSGLVKISTTTPYIWKR